MPTAAAALLLLLLLRVYDVMQMCGYCGTRSTSGCWRRGWEIGPNKFINLCNK